MKILFLAANPQSTTRLNLQEEARQIQEALDISELSREFELIQKWEVRAKDFRRALLRYRPDIVHFSGHGTGESGIIITEHPGESKTVTGDALAGLFAEFPQVKCVLLNACYAEAQAQAIVSHVDYVIGMRDTIYDSAAIAFSIGFYDGLGYGRTIEQAFNLGRNAILWEYKHDSGTTRQEIPVDSAQSEITEDLPEHLKPILLKKATNVALKITSQPQVATPNLNPEQKYRDRISKYLTENKLTPIAKFQLATFAQKQGISETAANEILEAESAKFEQNKATFRRLLKETIKEGNKLSDPQIQRQVQQLQQDFSLSNSQVEIIKEDVLNAIAAEAKPPETPTQENAPPERIINIYQGNYNENIQGNYSQPNPPAIPDSTINPSDKADQDNTPRDNNQPNQPSTTVSQASIETEKDNNPDLNTQTFSFEVITVDKRGEETSRVTKKAEFFAEDLGGGVTLEMVKISGGTFVMGSPEGEGREEEKPQHRVTVPSFWMGKYSVTQAQWQAVMGNNPSRLIRNLFKRNPLNPVENVSWNDTQKFCQQLSQQTTKTYRLPSEAEWEYACRAVNSEHLLAISEELAIVEWNQKHHQPFHFGETVTANLANYNGNRTYANESKGERRGQTTPVGSFSPNAFGLYDMHGNLWEWCEDDWHNNYDSAPSDGSAWASKKSNHKVIRGGSWYDSPPYCRSAIRSNNTRGFRNDFIGFCVVCVALKTT
ncbi:MAG: SUMF1/EgtB/PvdO family nonheme iron enzyme [Cyanobacteria bacterium J06621_8]